jgi:hypothetical protein
LFINSVSALIINEVMSNPIDDEDLNEWIEIYNNNDEAVNVSGWVIGDSNDNDTIEGGLYGGAGTVIPGFGYGIITDDKTRVYDNFNVSSNTIRLYVDDSAIGNGLGNNGECIYLYSSEGLVDSVCYEETDDGYSYALLNGNWMELMPTAGYNNNGSESFSSFCDVEIEILLEKNVFNNDVSWQIKVSKNKGDNVYFSVLGFVEDITGKVINDYHPWTNDSIINYKTKSYSPSLDYGIYLLKYNITYLNCNDDELSNNYDNRLIVVEPLALNENYSLEISEFLADPQGDDNAAMPYGEWIEIYNYGEDDVDLDGFVLKDDAGHDLIISDVKTSSGTVIKANDYLVVYTNGMSGFLNNEGYEKISLYYNDNLIDNVSYSDSVEGTSYAKINGEWKLSVPSPGSGNSVGEKSSSIEIEAIEDLGSDDEAKYGQIIRARLKVYKGDSSKNMIKLWAEDKKGKEISKQSKVMLYDKYNDYSLTIPVQLKSNCNNEFEEGDVTLFAEGLDTDDDYEFEIKGKEEENCEEISVENSSKKKGFEYSIVSKPTVVLAGENFETKVKLENNEDSDIDIEIWSYVYSGNKCYSGEREENKQSFSLEANSSIEVELANKVEEAGNFNFKVKIRKDEQKTTKDITDEIRVIDTNCEYSETTSGLGIGEEGVSGLSSYVNYSLMLPEIKGMVVYESTSEKSNRLVPYFFIFTLTLFCVFLIVRKKI